MLCGPICVLVQQHPFLGLIVTRLSFDYLSLLLSLVFLLFVPAWHTFQLLCAVPYMEGMKGGAKTHHVKLN